MTQKDVMEFSDRVAKIAKCLVVFFVRKASGVVGGSSPKCCERLSKNCCVARSCLAVSSNCFWSSWLYVFADVSRLFDWAFTGETSNHIQHKLAEREREGNNRENEILGCVRCTVTRCVSEDANRT